MGVAMRFFGGCLCLALGLLVLMAGSGAAQKAKQDEPIGVTAVELTKEWKKYEGKTVIVEGELRSRTKIVSVVLILDGYKGPREKERRRVFCNMKNGANIPTFRPGQTVKVRGKCAGPNGYSAVITIDLKDCEVVE